MSRRILIDPSPASKVTGKIDIFLDDKGDVQKAYLQIPELRGFEKFAEGRPAEDMPQITSRICAFAHGPPHGRHQGLGRPLQGRADRGREEDPGADLQHLLRRGSRPALLLPGRSRLRGGPGAPKAERNILGVLGKVGLDVARR